MHLQRPPTAREGRLIVVVAGVLFLIPLRGVRSQLRFGVRRGKGAQRYTNRNASLPTELRDLPRESTTDPGIRQVISRNPARQGLRLVHLPKATCTPCAAPYNRHCCASRCLPLCGWRDVGSRLYSSEGLFDYALYRNQLRLRPDEGARSKQTQA